MRKDFNDFRKTLTADKLSEIASNADEFTKNQPPIILSKNESNLGNQIGSLAMILSIDLLEAYHEWLLEQSEQ